ncbi:MAG: response regulator transcription factor [Holophagales bacterium]|nr:response regulator transcription factor [Holophagales bacterium]MYD21142.1 response regulator transcription factor [Holophagales bacterium]MYI32145.1 response regulator transcription factor [Holophagales bacterium]
MSARVLLVEDEPSLARTLSDRLAAEGHDVVIAADGPSGERSARDGGFDVVLLDVNLPGKNGFDVCRDLRRDGIDIPILMLTARNELVDRVVGLKLGADDYLAKPFETLELLARIEALMRRSRDGAQASASPREPTLHGYRFGNVRVDFDRAQVWRSGEDGAETEVACSALEYRLLRFLIEHRGEVHDRDRLLDEVWGYDATPTTRTVDVHVSSLRQKIEPNPGRPEFIVTVHGLGYRFDG